jgi:NAD(P)H-flavin reductase
VKDALPDALTAEERAEGWRLACQCQIAGDLRVAVFDPKVDGIPATLIAVDWLSVDVVRLRVQPERPVRYQPGQSIVLWVGGIARSYSIASLPGEAGWLEFHIDCGRPGRFCEVARGFTPGDKLSLGTLNPSALHYPADRPDSPLLLLASGSGLAPLWGILHEALRQEHAGPITIVHRARQGGEHYLRTALDALVAEHNGLSAEYLDKETWESWLKGFRLSSRHTVTLACGSPAFIEAVSRRLFMAGLPRGQLLTETFVSKAI